MGYRFPSEHERRIAFSSVIPPASEVRPTRKVTEASGAPAAAPKRQSQPSYAAIELVEANMARDPRFDPDTKA